MTCPICGAKTKVMDTRGDKQIVRRRKCDSCGHMVFTLEREINYSEGHDRYLAHIYKLNKRRREKKKNEDSKRVRVSTASSKDKN